ncbi:hypothetical protein [Flavobacterium sp.]|uniref:hypothetical protein n=1 Tax=Flavobacterium sp. TaxID=239 RepID=UPI004034CECF
MATLFISITQVIVVTRRTVTAIHIALRHRENWSTSSLPPKQSTITTVAPSVTVFFSFTPAAL